MVRARPRCCRFDKFKVPILLGVNSLRQRAFDRWFAVSFGALVVVYLGAMQLGATGTWHQLAAALLR